MYDFSVDEAVLYQDEVWYVSSRKDWHGEPWYIIRRNGATKHVAGWLITSLEDEYRAMLKLVEDFKSDLALRETMLYKMTGLTDWLQAGYTTEQYEFFTRYAEKYVINEGGG